VLVLVLRQPLGLPIDPALCDTATFQTAGLPARRRQTTNFINPLTTPGRDPALDHGRG